MSEPFCDWLRFMARIEIDRPWCVAICVAGREKAVQAELALAGWSTYLPMLTTTVGDRRRRRKVNHPLFARYLFAAVNEGGDLAAPSEIDGLVTMRRGMDAGKSVVRLDLLARLMLTELGHGFDLTYEKPRPKKGAFVCGQTVSVRAGVLKGWDALILKVLGEREVIAQYCLFGQVNEATFQTRHLEAA